MRRSRAAEPHHRITARIASLLDQMHAPAAVCVRELLAYGTSAPIGRITSFSAKFTDAPLAEGKFEIYLHERENAKKPRAVRLSRPSSQGLIVLQPDASD